MTNARGLEFVIRITLQTLAGPGGLLLLFPLSAALTHLEGS